MKSLVVILFLILTPISVFADGWSYGVDGGLVVPTQNYFPTNTGDGGTLSLPYFQALEASEGWIVSTYVTHTVWKPWLHIGILGSYDTTGSSITGIVTPSWLHNASSVGAKTNTGMLSTWAAMPYLRIDPWTFGNWTPFFGLGLGWSWNQWNTQGSPSFSASIANGLTTRIELGTQYAVSDRFSAEGMMGFTENDPLGSVNLPHGQGGMDQEFQMSFFFVEVGVNFSF